MDKITLYDESGEAIDFTLQAKFSIDEVDYVVLIPNNDETEQTYILRIATDENGEEILVGIDDEELKEAINAYEELSQN